MATSQLTGVPLLWNSLRPVSALVTFLNGEAYVTIRPTQGGGFTVSKVVLQ